MNLFRWKNWMHYDMLMYCRLQSMLLNALWTRTLVGVTYSIFTLVSLNLNHCKYLLCSLFLFAFEIYMWVCMIGWIFTYIHTYALIVFKQWMSHSVGELACKGCEKQASGCEYSSSDFWERCCGFAHSRETWFGHQPKLQEDFHRQSIMGEYNKGTWL